MVRHSISLSDELSKKVDIESKKLNMSFSGYIALAVTQKLQSDEMLSNLPLFINQIKELNDTIKSQNSAVDNG